MRTRSYRHLALTIGVAVVAALGLTGQAPAASPVDGADLTGRLKVDAVNSLATAGCSAGDYSYALQFTATNNVQDHTGCGIGDDAYNGWIGINGQITTPSTAPQMNAATDHNVAWVGAYWLNTDQWLQIGWYTGRISDGQSGCAVGHCVQRNGTYGMYVETHRGPGDYAVYDLGQLSPGQAVIYRVEYAPNAGSGCWAAYYKYSTRAMYACGLPTSGPMYAVNELLDRSGYARMGRADFGSATAGTNQTLRLMGSAGYEDWDQTLRAGGTRQSDERTNSVGFNLFMSSAKLWWHLKTYQG